MRHCAWFVDVQVDVDAMSFGAIDQMLQFPQALVMSLAFNYCFVMLWVSEYGEREGMKRYLSDIDPTTGSAPQPPPLSPGDAPPSNP